MTKKLYSFFILLGVTLLASFSAQAQIRDFTYGFHYSDTISKGSSVGRVFLWLPNSATTGGGLRGLILASQTVAEENFVRNPLIRAAAEEAQLGILYFNTGLLSGFGTGSDISADTALFLFALDKMATASGFDAVRHCPWLTFGHSSSSAFARNMAWWKPGRTLGAIIFKGGAISQPSWTTNSVATVPFMGFSGQYEEYGPNGGCANPRDSDANYRAVADSIIKLRQTTPRQLGMAVIAPGEGHFHFARPGADSLLYHFIIKATNARAPLGVYADSGEITLTTIDETTGWLADTSLAAPAIDSFPNMSAPESRFWFFDKAMAQAWLRLSANTTLLNLQRFRIANGTTPAISGVTGLNFNDCNGKSWVGNVTNGETFEIVELGPSGQGVETAATSGAVIPQGGNLYTANPAMTDFGGPWMQMYLPADVQTNRSGADRLVRLRLQNRTSGQNNALSINTIPDQTMGNTVTPAFNNPSGEPVFLTVLSGPAEVVNGQLSIVRIPARKDTLIVRVRAATAGNSSYAWSGIKETSFKVYQTIVSSPKDIALSALTIFPNPAKDRVTLSNPAGQDITWRLFSTTGQIVNTGRTQSTTTTLELNQCTGVYYLHTQNGGATKVFKVMIL